MKMMCPHCGSPNLDTEAICYDCSKSLHVAESSAKPASRIVAPAAAAKRPAAKPAVPEPEPEPAKGLRRKRAD